MRSIFISLYLLTFIACTTQTEEIENINVIDVNLDSLEKSRTDKPLPPFAIYSEYNFIELKSKDSVLFFRITEWFHGNDVIIDKKYLEGDGVRLTQVIDLNTFLDSLLSNRQKLLGDYYTTKITILSDTSIVRNNVIFKKFKTSNRDTVKFIARKLFDFEKELIPKVCCGKIE
jgi:hypothetical protein